MKAPTHTGCKGASSASGRKSAASASTSVNSLSNAPSFEAWPYSRASMPSAALQAMRSSIHKGISASAACGAAFSASAAYKPTPSTTETAQVSSVTWLAVMPAACSAPTAGRSSDWKRGLSR